MKRAQDRDSLIFAGAVQVVRVSDEEVDVIVSHPELRTPVRLRSEGEDDYWLKSLIDERLAQTEAIAVENLVGGWETVEFTNKQGSFRIELQEDGNVLASAEPVDVHGGYYEATALLLRRGDVGKWFERRLVPFAQRPESMAPLLVTPFVADQVFGMLRHNIEQVLAQVPAWQHLTYETYGQPWSDLAATEQANWWNGRVDST